MKEILEMVVNECSDEVARAYAKDALDLGLEGEPLKVQILHLLANARKWRGERAREIKRALREYAWSTFEAKNFFESEQAYEQFIRNILSLFLVENLTKVELRILCYKFRRAFRQRDSKLDLARKIAKDIYEKEPNYLKALAEEAKAFWTNKLNFDNHRTKAHYSSKIDRAVQILHNLGGMTHGESEAN